jgi:hypothetical protein
MSELLQRITTWISIEPTIGLLMVVTAIVLFGSAFGRVKRKSDSLWPWLRHLLEASVGALIGAVLFIGLLWAFRAILNDNIATFYSTHGSRSDVSSASAQTIWGRPHQQVELTVKHTHEVETQVEVPSTDPSQPSTYRTESHTEEVVQNSIVGFKGTVNMVLSEREKGYALYSGYTIDVTLQYDILNDSDIKTDATFAFELSPGQTLFENFIIMVDGRDMSPDLRFSHDVITWTTAMRPHQQSVFCKIK